MYHKPIIRMQNVTKTVQQREIIRSCNLTVHEGSIYGILGPNGAGKTTLFKLLIGCIHATAGKIEVFGMDISTERNSMMKRIGSMIESPVFYEHLSAAQNLKIHLSYMGRKSDDVADYLEMVGLHQTGHQPVAQFSMGMRQRLGVARAIAHQPQVLILDEPTNGLDPMGIRLMRRLFAKLAADHGMTILVSSHILSEIEQVADTIGIISNGTIVEEANLEELRKQFPEGLEDYFINVLQKEPVR